MILIINQTSSPLFEDLLIALKKKSKIKLFKGIEYKRNNFLARIYTWLLYTIQVAIHLARFKRNYKKILVVTNPPFTQYIVALSGIPFSILVYDIYPNVLAQLNLPKKLFLIICRFWNLLNLYSFKRSTYIFTLTKEMSKELKSIFNSSQEWGKKVKVIKPWINSSLTKNFHKTVRFKRNDDSKILISYAGNLGLTHPIEPLLNSAKTIYKNVEIVIVGDGPKKSSLIELSKKYNLNKDTLKFMNPLPIKKLIALSKASDLAVVAIDGPSSNSSLPSKLFTAIFTSTPILAIAPINSSLSRIINYYNCGFIIEPNKNTEKNIINCINNLIKNPELINSKKINMKKASNSFNVKNANLLVDLFLS